MTTSVITTRSCPPHIWNRDCPTVMQKGCDCGAYRSYTPEESREYDARREDELSLTIIPGSRTMNDTYTGTPANGRAPQTEPATAKECACTEPHMGVVTYKLDVEQPTICTGCGLNWSAEKKAQHDAWCDAQYEKEDACGAAEPESALRGAAQAYFDYATRTGCAGRGGPEWNALSAALLSTEHC